MARNKLALALDTADLDDAIRLAELVTPYMGIVKVGLQLFSAAGVSAIDAMRERNLDVFLDVKLHDIPNTVGRAAAVLGECGAQYLTMHASGGEAMLRAGVEGLAEGATKTGNETPTALAVTVLTSDANALPSTLSDRVKTAVAAGCPGVICAVDDLPIVKGTAPEIKAVTPGIRPAGTSADDQGRIATPAKAIAGGAHFLVIGRAVTNAADPAAAAEAIHNEAAVAL
ncbi:MAG: orotidine-5'-phosphate decarboxylase [Actinomycetota bacterium]